jgi:hypothetical protein
MAHESHRFHMKKNGRPINPTIVLYPSGFDDKINEMESIRLYIMQSGTIRKTLLDPMIISRNRNSGSIIFAYKNNGNMASGIANPTCGIKRT